ncbi:MAG: hypothetical protein CFE26_01605 [Verrucomicrobiales bacterium VVV1]|nr:MAG: hypothetical protein CFE26_01605 [Verrucomicrobiales bacterium VVV1]
MKKFIQILALTGGLSLTLILLNLVCHRYPTVDEIEHQYRISPITSCHIDTSQGDIGFFGIATTSPSGNETFCIETSKKWTWPWQPYNWRTD